MGMTQIPSKAPAVTIGWTVEIEYVAGGSFAQVIVRDTLGVRAFHKVLEPFQAMRLFESLRRA
jgi:hypothetical protein